MAGFKKSEQVPKLMQDTFNAIVTLTDTYCNTHLNAEYAQLAREATAALCRKRPSPLTTGKASTWACGIVYAIGFVNFLFDKSSSPSTTAEELCTAFGLSKSSGYNKSKAVRDALDMMQMDPKWSLPSRLDNNPLVWMISIDGMVFDARHLRREIQEALYAKGLIPYVPEPRIGEE